MSDDTPSPLNNVITIDDERSTKRYLNIELLKDQQMRGAIIA